MSRQSTLRTEETERAYAILRESGVMERECAICKGVAVESFTYWKIMANDFPYDKIAQRHDMIVPLRHTATVTPEEIQELEEIKKSYLDSHYNYIMEATHPTKSIPGHYHLHLVDLKEDI